MKVPFNQVYLTGQEQQFMLEAAATGKLSGDGIFTHKCHAFFEATYKFDKVLLTTSCTTALEMAALLIELEAGDEVIMPTYTFVSTANAFLMHGAKLVFADCQPNYPNIAPQEIERLITPKTKAIVVVHYAGLACQMNEIMHIANQHGLFVIEDAAHAINASFSGKPLGGIGHLSAFSFHDTKNIIAGEGGMLVLNDPQFVERAEILREKGTNRAAFYRGEVRKYEWVDIGSSYLPSEITAAFLYAQLLHLNEIQAKRIAIWKYYQEQLLPLAQQGFFELPQVPHYATVNGHIFFIICKSEEERKALIHFLKEREVCAVFHYLSLHSSPYFKQQYEGQPLPNADRFTTCLLRLPIFYALNKTQQDWVINSIEEFYKGN